MLKSGTRIASHEGASEECSSENIGRSGQKGAKCDYHLQCGPQSIKQFMRIIDLGHTRLVKYDKNARN